jgi:hypothetical protein
MAGGVRSKESASFLKKRSKKLLLFRVMGCDGDEAHGPVSRSFLVLFFKKEPLPF